METPERRANRFLTSPLARLSNQLLSNLPLEDPDCDDPLLEDCGAPQPLDSKAEEVEAAWAAFLASPPRNPLPPQDLDDLEF